MLVSRDRIEDPFTFLSECNGKFRKNLSEPYREYSNRPVVVLWFTTDRAMILDAHDAVGRVVSRNHLVIF